MNWDFYLGAVVGTAMGALLTHQMWRQRMKAIGAALDGLIVKMRQAREAQ